MPQGNIVNTQCEIKVGGTALTSEEQNLVVETTVDQHTHLPHMFTIRMYDPGMKLLDSKKFDLTKEVEISGTTETGTKIKLIKGEITALEPEFQEGTVFVLVIRGYDKSHRLFRESKSKAFLNIKDSDLASQFAGGAGLSAQVDATSTVYDHLYQDNQTDLAFLMQRAWRIGYECFVDDGKLYFRKPPSSGTTATLSWGEDLISFYPSMTLAEQVDSVEVKGWDPKTLQAILGKAQTGTLYPKNGDSKNGATWAGSFGTGKHTLVDIPVVSQAEANKIAEARLNELSGAFVEADGTAIRRPDIKAGQFVKLEDLGTRMSGTYMVTSATHVFTYEGLITHFKVSGTRTGLLLEQMARQEPVKRWPGVVTAVVTNTDDPDNWGRVKIKYPWLTDDAETFWARLAGPGAGPTAGFIAIPEVGDEVLVAFEHGDINYPVIIGGLWNGKHAIPAPTAGAAAGEKPLVRTWQSINGHIIAMYDNADQKIEILTTNGHAILIDDTNKKLEIKTSGGHSATFDDQGKKIEIKSSGGHKIVLDDNGRKVTVESSGDVEIKSAMNMKLQAGMNLDLQGGAMVNIKGPLVKIN
ncbi:MAG: VgrG-related protein [Anaerolineae bacterium]|nr:VgrG-related protein [Anaerolineae bacterium]